MIKRWNYGLKSSNPHAESVRHPNLRKLGYRTYLDLAMMVTIFPGLTSGCRFGLYRRVGFQVFKTEQSKLTKIFRIPQEEQQVRFRAETERASSRNPYREDPSVMSCRQCRSKRVHQSRRTGMIERIILSLIFVRPFRCEECDFRFYRWSFSAHARSARASLEF
jgi:hypothetical protein